MKSRIKVISVKLTHEDDDDDDEVFAAAASLR